MDLLFLHPLSKGDNYIKWTSSALALANHVHSQRCERVAQIVVSQKGKSGRHSFLFVAFANPLRFLQFGCEPLYDEAMNH
jgi:hypothetical protein